MCVCVYVRVCTHCFSISFIEINQVYSFMLCLKITHCSLLGSCISFVMKSVEGANFKIISPTQRTPFTRDAQRAETSTQI